jgi:hypothetical protein
VVGRDERCDLSVGQVQAAFEELTERAMRIALKRLAEALVGQQPANHHLDAALRHPRSSVPAYRKAAASAALAQIAHGK